MKTEVGQLDGRVTSSSQDLVQLKSRMEAVMGAGSNLALNGDFNLGAGTGWTFFNTTAASVVREGRGNSLCWKAEPYAGGSNTVVSAAVNEGRVITLTPAVAIECRAGRGPARTSTAPPTIQSCASPTTTAT